MTCCQFADDETIDTDPTLFDCQTCQLADALDQLWPENRAAWHIYQRLARRFIVEAGLLPDVFRCLTADLAPEDLDDLFDRLGEIYDVVNPKKDP